MVHSVDESVGRVLKRLDSRGIAKRTVVVFVSDNGGHVVQFDDLQITNNLPLRSGKGSLYEGGIRVPLVVRWPGVTTAGGVCREPVFVADLYPTLAEIAHPEDGKAKNDDSDGLSLMPLLKQPTATLDRTALYFHYPHYYPTTTPVGAIRAGDWKLLEYFEDNHTELYNLRDDLGESNDLASKQFAKANELRGRLHDWRKAIQAAMPTANPDYRPDR